MAGEEDWGGENGGTGGEIVSSSRLHLTAEDHLPRVCLSPIVMAVPDAVVDDASCPVMRLSIHCGRGAG